MVSMIPFFSWISSRNKLVFRQQGAAVASWRYHSPVAIPSTWYLTATSSALMAKRSLWCVGGGSDARLQTNNFCTKPTMQAAIVSRLALMRLSVTSAWPITATTGAVGVQVLMTLKAAAHWPQVVWQGTHVLVAMIYAPTSHHQTWAISAVIQLILPQPLPYQPQQQGPKASQWPPSMCLWPVCSCCVWCWFSRLYSCV